jgi:hypothetical protein
MKWICEWWIGKWESIIFQSCPTGLIGFGSDSFMRCIGRPRYPFSVEMPSKEHPPLQKIVPDQKSLIDVGAAYGREKLVPYHSIWFPISCGDNFGWLVTDLFRSSWILRPHPHDQHWLTSPQRPKTRWIIPSKTVWETFKKRRSWQQKVQRSEWQFQIDVAILRE